MESWYCAYTMAKARQAQILGDATVFILLRDAKQREPGRLVASPQTTPRRTPNMRALLATLLCRSGHLLVKIGSSLQQPSA